MARWFVPGCPGSAGPAFYRSAVRRPLFCSTHCMPLPSFNPLSHADWTSPLVFTSPGFQAGTIQALPIRAPCQPSLPCPSVGFFSQSLLHLFPNPQPGFYLSWLLTFTRRIVLICDIPAILEWNLQWVFGEVPFPRGASLHHFLVPCLRTFTPHLSQHFLHSRQTRGVAISSQSRDPSTQPLHSLTCLMFHSFPANWNFMIYFFVLLVCLLSLFYSSEFQWRSGISNSVTLRMTPWIWGHWSEQEIHC